jgi:hypothetical protein
MSMSRRAGWRRSSEPLEIGEPDLDQRLDRPLEPGLAGHLERLLVALPRLGRIDALLEPVVARHEQLLDPLARVAPLHVGSLAVHLSVYQGWKQPPATPTRRSAF